jgi:hypothetical protein
MCIGGRPDTPLGKQVILERERERERNRTYSTISILIGYTEIGLLLQL